MLIMRSSASIEGLVAAALGTRRCQCLATPGNRSTVLRTSSRGPSVILLSLKLPSVSNIRVVGGVHA